MGVPALFRWLSGKYPKVIIECEETKQVDPDTGKNIYDDATLPNPNGIEFDNLYLDMNSIIHPKDKPAPKNEDEMMVAIFECIDRLMNIVRPRKVVYMAIDGVAPRAKMNQQRSRRFRAAKEAVEKRVEMKRIRSVLAARCCILPPEKENEEHFDSNCITPGTRFMERLSLCLHYYIHDRLNNNPAWKDIKVILSDANVPGEGKHKIMDFIRKQRSQPDYDTNTQHVFCGADADLIMLGLATHEPNFTIIREEFLPYKPKPCEICSEFGHKMNKCQGLNAASVNDVTYFKPDAEVKFIFVRLRVLREYLKKTLEMPNLPFKYEFERVLDDWVFICLFVDNDFLPHLPSLEIHEGAVDRLVELYKKCAYRNGGFLTDSGEVNLDRLQLIISDLGNMEDQIFKDRQRNEQQFKQREKAKKRREEGGSLNVSVMEHTLTNLGSVSARCPNPLPLIDIYKQDAPNLRNASSSNYQQQQQREFKRSAVQARLDEDEDEKHKNIEVNNFSKFDVDKDILCFRYTVALQYVRGICWVLKYCYQGCASWNWYFPYHYAPLASDFGIITGLSIQFDKDSKPLNPLEQLMAVLPAASSSHVPQSWAKLMHDPQSDIIDLYPEDFKIEPFLPFVDENRLFKALKPYYGLLTQKEIKRNKQGDCRLYISPGNASFKTLSLYYANKTFKHYPEIPIIMEGMRGIILYSDENIPIKGILHSPIMGLNDITDNHAVTVRFRDPQYDQDFKFPAVLLSNDNDRPNILGFNHNVPQAYVIQGGHRMLNNSMGGNGAAAGVDRNQYQQQSYNYNNTNNQVDYGGGVGRGQVVRGDGQGGYQQKPHYDTGINSQQQQQQKSSFNSYQNSYRNNNNTVFYFQQQQQQQQQQNSSFNLYQNIYRNKNYKNKTGYYSQQKRLKSSSNSYQNIYRNTNYNNNNNNRYNNNYNNNILRSACLF